MEKYEPPFYGHTPSHFHPLPPEKEEKIFKPLTNSEIFRLVSKVFKL